MSDSKLDPIPVLWVAPHVEFALGAISEQLAARGYRILRCLPGQSKGASAAVRILQADLFPDIRQLRVEAQADPRPTLIIASNEDQEIAVLDFISHTSDVVRGPYPIELLTFRLGRLLQQSAGLARIDALQFQDPLTGLPNRRRLETLMVDFLDLNAGQDCRAIVIFDLDRFKQINDRFGHAVGDNILFGFAAVLQQGAAPGDRFARIGGEEFVGFLSRYDQATAIIDVEKILKRVEKHEFIVTLPGTQEPKSGTTQGVLSKYGLRNIVFHSSSSAAGTPTNIRIPVTVSAGMTFVQPGRDAASLFDEADHALYSAKERGRNQLVVYQGMKASADAENKDLRIEHFKNVARVLNDRMTDLITRFAQNLVEEARREANHDYLTGLYNRRYFDAKLPREIERSDAYKRPLTIALIDLDQFGEINDKYGYPTGSEVLSRFVHIVTGCVRSMDWMARYGGDEFCLVMPDTELEAAMQIAERIRATVESAEMKSLDHRPLALTVSVGVAAWSGACGGPIQLLQIASNAVRQAKHTGRNRVIAGR